MVRNQYPQFFTEHGVALHPFDREALSMQMDIAGVEFLSKSLCFVPLISNGLSKRKFSEVGSNSQDLLMLGSSKSKSNQLVRCKSCDSLVWVAESSGKDRVTKSLLFTICCKQGRVKLPNIQDPPHVLHRLLSDSSFRDNIRVYNSMLSMCSMGAEVDYSVLNSRGPYCFKVHGENYHSIGSLLPNDGEKPKFLQMYIYDTSNEIRNRISSIGRGNKLDVSEATLGALISMLDESNELTKIFRKARDRYEVDNNVEMAIHLVGYDKRKREYELPVASEIAGLVVGDFSGDVRERDILIQHKSGMSQRIMCTHPLYMSLQYPLLFPYGEVGYYDGILYNSQNESSSCRGYVSMTEYYMYRMHNRSIEASTILRGERLFHQFMVDVYTSIESYRLTFIKLNQKAIRADVYSNVKDAISKGDHDPRCLGKRIILPSSHTGSPRYMAEKYQDAMALCRSFGNPDLFITMTANPKWDEVNDFLSISGDKSYGDTPDVVSRVFHIKLGELKDLIKKKHFFGRINGVVYTIEFQKRGLPHAHILIWLKDRHDNVSSSDIDSIISAEIPNKFIDPIGYALVEQHMIHGPCGVYRPNNVCMLNGTCSKKYPRDYCVSLCVDENGYILYKRRDDASRFVIKGDVHLSNQFVVPYNLELLKIFQAHINVEFCNKTSAVKYLFKYITKGSDKATIVIGKKVLNGDVSICEEVVYNEIENYLDCRYVSACESIWRIFKFEIHYQHPPVQRLSIHLPDQQSILFKENIDLDMLVANNEEQQSMFLAFFEMNKVDCDARNLSYVQFPARYVWNRGTHTWSKRKKGESVGRIYNIHPSCGELYYLKILINHVRGPTRYDDLLSLNGKVYKTFKESCVARGLLEGDQEWQDAMKEAVIWASPYQLRQLFAMLLAHCEVTNLLELWNTWWKHLSEDMAYQ